MTSSFLFGKILRSLNGLGTGLLRFVWLAFQILHNDGDSPIGCSQRFVFLARHLISVASNLRDLIVSHTVMLHQPPSGVGPIGGKFPIAVFATAGVGFCVGVAFDREVIGKLSQFVRQE